jgi:hypothetical protein
MDDEYKTKIASLEEKLSVLEDRESDLLDKRFDMEYRVKKLNEKRNPEDFYDIIIKLESIEQLVEGCSIYQNERYRKFKEIKTIVVGVLGNFNRGKTHTIFKLSSEDNIPSGFVVSTQGLSIKYPNEGGDVITFLDVAGSETALKYGTINPDDKEAKSRMSIDRIHTNNFLNGFVIRNSDIFICVVNKLTFTDQKLINRLKLAVGGDKELLVFHNLYNFETIKEVEDYIQETLLQSFPFEKKGKHSYAGESTLVGGKNIYYYYEDFGRVSHHIMAKDDTQAGEYYNGTTLKWIRQRINGITERKTFDPIELIKQQLKDDKSEIFVDPSVVVDVVTIGDTIALRNKHEVKLQPLAVDSFGYNTTQKERYSLYKSENKLLILLEEPSLDLDSLNIHEVVLKDGSTAYTIKAKKRMTEQSNMDVFKKNIKDTIHVEVLIKHDEGIVTKDKPEIKNNGDGTISITYDLKATK